MKAREAVELIRISLDLLRVDATQAARGLIDSGSVATTISRKIVQQMSLAVDASSTRVFHAVNGTRVVNYGTTELDINISDSDSKARTMRVVFEVVDQGEEVILGKDWLAKHNPVINWTSNHWRWRSDDSKIEIVSAEDFHEELYSNEVYSLFYRSDWPAPIRVDDASPSQRYINAVEADAADENFPIPEYLADYADVFDDKAAAILPHHNKFDHAIDTVDGKDPPYGPLYNLSQDELKVLRDYLEEATKQGWIRRSTSPAGAPILFVKKKNNAGLRLCVDYRGLNQITIKNRHPLPLISETLDRLQGSKIYTKLDLKDAYYRIRIKEGDEWKTAFRTRYGHFEYLIMPFGLANAPATFQAYISQALLGLVDITCVVYMDDILIYSDDDSQSHRRHHDDVKEVLERLRKFKLYANRKKCEFDTNRVEFLGFVVDTQGVSMEPSRVTSVTEWPAPKTFKELQMFLGFANFYRRFIAGYSKAIRSLTDMLKGMQAGVKTGPFDWGTAQQEAFDDLKRRFKSAEILIHFDPELPILLETDASGFAIGAVLSQKHQRLADDATSRQWRPVAFYSRKMIDAETRYETHDGELLAIVESFRHWRHYLEGSKWPVTVKTDHNSLRFFMTQKSLNRRQARWAEQLAVFDFIIEYRTGITNPADGPSRRPDYQSDVDHAEILLPTLQRKLKNSGLEKLTYEDRHALAALVTRWRDVRATVQTIVSQQVTQAEFQHSEKLREYEEWAVNLAPEWGGEEMSPALRKDSDCAAAATPLEQHYLFQRNLSCRINSLIAGRTEESGETPIPFDLRHLPESAISGLKELNSFEDGDGEAHSPLQRGNCADDPQYDQPRPDDEEIFEGTMDEIHSIPRLLASIATMGLNSYDEPSESVEELVKSAQQRDPFVTEKQWASPASSRRRDVGYAMRSDGLLAKDGKIYIPNDAALRAELLKLCHDDPLSSHFGAAKTTELLQRHYYWDSLLSDVKEYVRTCDTCQRTKTRRHRPYGELASLPLPLGPWQEITMDFITDLPPSPGYGQHWDSIFVVVDRYTKMALYIPCQKTLDADDLATAFLRRVACAFGLPKGIVSDRGSVFTSKFWSAFCYHMKVKRRLSTAFHPQTDGQTERQNQTLEHYLRCYCNYRQTDWVDKLPLAEFTYNNSIHSTTNRTPFYSLYGYNPTMRLHIDADSPTDNPEAELRITRVQEEREELTQRWSSAVAAQQRGYNKRHQPMTFAVGDEVMVSAKHIRQLRQSKKLSDRYLGPFKITAIHGDHKQAYKLDLPPKWKIHPVFHVSLLEKYNSRAGEAPTKPKELDLEDEEFWEVEAILAHRDKKGVGREYLVRWKGWPPSEDSWEPRDHFGNQAKLRKYDRDAEVTSGAVEAPATRVRSARATKSRR